MRRLSLITAFLGFILLVFASGVNAEQYAKLEDSFNKYSLEYPSSWKLKKTPKSNDLIKAHLDKGNDSGLQVRIYNNNKKFEDFVNWYIQDYKKQMETHHKGKMKVVKARFTIPGGPKAYYISIDFVSGKNERWFVKQYLWPRRDKVYLIQSGCLYKDRKEFEPVIDKIAYSFRFLR